MSKDLESTLATLRNYVAANGLAGQVSMRMEGDRIKITLLAEGRDLWLGRRYYLVSDPSEEPQNFFDLREEVFARLLALPPSAGTESGQSHFFFVSYSRRDEGLVAPIVDLLRLADTEVFRDRDNIRAGNKWRQTIEAAIEKATEFLVFWCEHASSPEITREVGLALNLGKKIVPVLLDDSAMSQELAEFQAIDLRFLEPHSRTSAETKPDDASSVASATPSAPSQEVLAEYLTQRLADLLGIKRSLEITEGRPPLATETTAD